MLEYWRQFKDLICNQEHFKLLAINYNSQTIINRKYISKINSVNVLE